MTANELIAEIYGVILGVRSALDAPFAFSRGRRTRDRDQVLKRALIKLEDVRLDAVALRRGRDEPRLELLDDVRSGLVRLLDDPEFLDPTSGRRFRPAPPMSRQQLPPEYLDGDLTIPEALMLLLQRMDSFGRAASGAPADLAALRRVVPEQKLAPAMFDIKNNRLVLRRQSAQAGPDDLRNVKKGERCAFGARPEHYRSVGEVKLRSPCTG